MICYGYAEILTMVEWVGFYLFNYLCDFDKFLAILLKINSGTMGLMSFGIMSMMPKFAYRSL